MNQRSRFDPNQITQLTFDEKSYSSRTKIVDTEFSIELDHNDGDSVTSHPAKLIASAIGCQESDANKDVIPALDCSSLKTVRVDVEGTGQIEILASPNDTGNYFYSVGMSGIIFDICARRIKVKSIDAIGNVHLVGQG